VRGPRCGWSEGVWELPLNLAVWLVLHPLCEPLHSGMVSQRLDGVIASSEVRVADGDVDIAVAGAAQDDRPARVASLELLPALPSALHPPSAGARQEVVAGKAVLPYAPATQLASAPSAQFEVLFAWHHPEIIRALYTSGSRRRLPCTLAGHRAAIARIAENAKNTGPA
jgi:hypothetical protein